MPYPPQTPPQPPIQIPTSPPPTPRPAPHPWQGRWAFALYGLVLGLLVVFLVGCSSVEPTAVEPGSGPAATEPADSQSEPPDTSGTMTGSYGDKVVYPDGVAVEVIRIKHAKLSESGVGDKGQGAGDPIQVLQIRVTNGSKAPIEVDAASGTMTYGPDGQEASIVSDAGITSMSGKVLPGKAKTGTYGYAVPKRYLGDTQLEFIFDYDHGSVIFTGPLR